MKKFKSLVALSLVFAMLLSLNIMSGVFANLNGTTCQGADFDKSVYTSVTYHDEIVYGNYQWPASGAVLIGESGRGWDITDFIGITIPAGITVDIYKYYKAGGDPDWTYTLIGHFDTTDGKPYTIGANDNMNSVSANSVPSYSDEAKWGTVKKVITAGTPSASYKTSFTDVPSDAWYYHAVMTLSDGGLLNGYGGGLFGPNDALTRAQLAIIRMRTGAKELSEYVIYGTYDGYRAYDDNETATRAWAAIMLAGTMPTRVNTHNLTSYEQSLIADSTGLSADDRYKIDMYESVYDTWRASLGKNIKYRSSIDQFPDADAIHKWIDENADLVSKFFYIRSTHEVCVQVCERYFLRAYNLGMFSGVDAEGTFDPYGTLTRGQLCQALYNVGWTYSGVLEGYLSK